MCAAATARGWSSEACPMSDGGEGFVDALGGVPRTTTVTGPLGTRVVAQWALREDGTAVLESAEAVGRRLVPHPTGEDPVAASSEGVGELLAAALEAGASSIVLGCGGTASTDGGLGCLEAARGPRRTRHGAPRRRLRRRRHVRRRRSAVRAAEGRDPSPGRPARGTARRPRRSVRGALRRRRHRRARRGRRRRARGRARRPRRCRGLRGPARRRRAGACREDRESGRRRDRRGSPHAHDARGQGP